MFRKEEEQEEQELEHLIKLMFEAELYYMQEEAENEKPVEFSDGFERRMERLIKSQRRKAQIRKAVKYALPAAAVLLIVFCLIRPGIVAKAWDVVVRWHSTHLEVDLPDAEWTGPVPEYELTYVPEGFELAKKDCDEFGGVILYENGENYLRLSYSLAGGNYKYDNEHSEISVIEDEEGNAVLFIKYESGGYSMLWDLDDEIMFSLYALVTEDELFKIKNGIKIKKI